MMEGKYAKLNASSGEDNDSVGSRFLPITITLVLRRDAHERLGSLSKEDMVIGCATKIIIPSRQGLFIITPLDPSIVPKENSPRNFRCGQGYKVMRRMEECGVMQSIEKNTGPTFAAYFEEDAVGNADDEVKYVESPPGTYTTPSPMKSPVNSDHHTTDPLLESPFTLSPQRFLFHMTRRGVNRKCVQNYIQSFFQKSRGRSRALPGPLSLALSSDK